MRKLIGYRIKWYVEGMESPHHGTYLKELQPFERADEFGAKSEARIFCKWADAARWLIDRDWPLFDRECDRVGLLSGIISYAGIVAVYKVRKKK